MDELKQLTDAVIAFRDARDWKQFHNPKDVAISLSLESSELLEHFQWKSSDEIEQYIQSNKSEISNELADVFYWLLLMSNDLEIDLSEALKSKLAINAAKYPIEKAKGQKVKYTKL